LAVSTSYLRAVEGMEVGPDEFDDLAAILAAGFLQARPVSGQAETPR
jgi:hypothetical protein